MVSFSCNFSFMELKNPTISDQFPSSPIRKVVSRFRLGIVLSFIVLSVILFNVSFKAPFLNPVFQGLNRFGSRSNSSILSWPFSPFSSNSCNSTSSCNDTSIVQNFQNPIVNKSRDFFDSDGKIDPFESTHLGNVSEKLKDGSFIANEAEKNGSAIGKNAISRGVAVNGIDLENSHLVNLTVNATNQSVGVRENVGLVNHTNNGDLTDEGIKNSNSNYSSFKECDIFNGRWVKDNTKPYYPPGSCPFIDRDFDCHLNGRPDNDYVKWRWQPYGCNIPSFNATDFLERLRNQKLVFVGDSLNRNMWESLICLLRHSVKDKKRVYEISGRREFKKKGFYAFRFEDYNCSVDFVSSPFLVKESSFKGQNGSFETLRLDLMDGTTSMYHDADVLVFNTGHWWTHEKTSKGEGYYQEGNYIHPKLKVLDAYKRALATWARWVDKNIDGTKTQVIFRGFSVTHFRGGPWNSGGQCHKETEPIFNETYLAKYPSKMKVFEHAIQGMKTPLVYLNISRLTDYRKDAHPSIYRPDYEATRQNIASVHAQDCSHWCLPGVPDTWNELLYISLLKKGTGSWGTEM